MDVFAELESLAKAAHNSDQLAADNTEDDSILRWQHIFGYTAEEAERLISRLRADLSGSMIDSSLWEMMSTREDAKGHNRLSYSHHLHLMKQQGPTASNIPSTHQPLDHEAMKREYLVRLEGCIDNAAKLQAICGLTYLPKTYNEAPGSEGSTGVSFCRIDGGARSTLLEYIKTSNTPSFRPLFVLQSIAGKDFDDNSIAPTLGKDATMPQFRLAADKSPQPSGREFPVWYFFYGTPADPEVLNRLFAGLKTKDVVEDDFWPASIIGGRLTTWNGVYRALVDCPGSAVEGYAFEVESEEHEDALRLYETQAYEVVRCEDMSIDGVGVVRGCTFRFVGKTDG